MPIDPTIPSTPVSGRLRMALIPMPTMKSENTAAKPMTGKMTPHES